MVRNKRNAMAAPWCFASRPDIILNAGEFLLYHHRPYGTSSASPASRLVAGSSRQVRLPSTTAQPLPVNMASRPHRPTPDLAAPGAPSQPPGSGVSPENAVLARIQPPLLPVEPPRLGSGRPRDVPPRQAPSSRGSPSLHRAAAVRAEEDGASASIPRASPVCVLTAPSPVRPSQPVSLSRIH